MNECPECKSKIDPPQKNCELCGYEIEHNLTQEQTIFLRRRPFAAFLCTPIYAFGMRQYGWCILALFPFTYRIALVYLVLYGRKRAWRYGGWSSSEAFKQREEKALLVSIVIVSIVAVVILYISLR